MPQSGRRKNDGTASPRASSSRGARPHGGRARTGEQLAHVGDDNVNDVERVSLCNQVV